MAPLPGTENPEKLVQIFRRWPGIEHGSTSIPHYQDIRDRSGEVFENVVMWDFAPISLSADGRSERILGMLVSANFFQTYGVTPVVGRAFIPGEEDVGPGAHPVTVLGHAFWQTRFGGDPSVVGRSIVLNGHPFEVVGIAPADFKGPLKIADAPLYVPLMMVQQILPGHNLIEARGNNRFRTIGRLRAEATLEQAGDVFDAILLQLGRSSPELCVKVRGSSSMLRLGYLGDLLRFEKREIEVAAFAPDRSSPQSNRGDEAERTGSVGEGAGAPDPTLDLGVQALEAVRGA